MAKGKGLCGHCKTRLTEFNCAPSMLSSGYGFCRECRKEAERLRYRRNPARQKEATARWVKSSGAHGRKSRTKTITAWHRKKKFGITQEEFDAKFASQSGLCEICKQSMDGGSRTKVPCQDHDHQTGENRDLLCVNCNVLLGNCFEKEEILASAIKYLRKHKK